MQKRQSDRAMYFKELAATSKKYYIPYIQTYKAIKTVSEYTGNRMWRWRQLAAFFRNGV